jgi:hypothetical protein
VKKILVLTVILVGVIAAGLVYAGPLAVASHMDTVVSIDASTAPELPTQLAQYQRHRCYCCWQSYRHGWRCRWMHPWKCRDRGGWCRR